MAAPKRKRYDEEKGPLGGKLDSELAARRRMREQAIMLGISPLEVMLIVMRDFHQRAENAYRDGEDDDVCVRWRLYSMSAAKEAAPYMHNKMAAVLTPVSSSEEAMSLNISFVPSSAPGVVESSIDDAIEGEAP